MASLSSAYLAPVQYYCKLIEYKRIIIDSHEHYIKQTYRNRCQIATANGIQSLTIPIEHPSSPHCQLSIVNCQLKDVLISDHGHWQHVHWQALVSAYGMSPFFEYYEDDFAPFYRQKYRFLFDFNEQLRLKICELLDIRPNISYADDYEALVPNDFRDTIRPRRPTPDPSFHPQPYYQVFREKYGFQPNLSIVDLLFNMGPESILVLQNSITKR
ncbi:MAG: WbqC family protein [Tannerella sp.]|jgi:hypothetical protein|nr:WbqC family protein [Tannerella sp.]